MKIDWHCAQILQFIQIVFVRQFIPLPLKAIMEDDLHVRSGSQFVIHTKNWLSSFKSS